MVACWRAGAFDSTVRAWSVGRTKVGHFAETPVARRLHTVRPAFSAQVCLACACAPRVGTGMETETEADNEVFAHATRARLLGSSTVHPKTASRGNLPLRLSCPPVSSNPRSFCIAAASFASRVLC